MPSNLSVATTILRDQLTKVQLASLDGAIPLPPGSVIELTDGRCCRVVAVRLMLCGTGAADLVLEVQGI